MKYKKIENVHLFQYKLYIHPRLATRLGMGAAHLT